MTFLALIAAWVHRDRSTVVGEWRL